MIFILKAKDIRIGIQLAEVDGFLFEVIEIIKQIPKTITIRLCSDFSSMTNHWSTESTGDRTVLSKLFIKALILFLIFNGMCAETETYFNDSMFTT